jgi:hypothetical protein
MVLSASSRTRGSGSRDSTVPIRGEFTLLADFVYSQNGGSGPRPNNALEGLSLSPDGRFLFAAMEARLVEDGPAVNADDGALISASSPN